MLNYLFCDFYLLFIFSERQEKEEFEKMTAEFLGDIEKKLSAEAENAKEKTIEVKKMIVSSYNLF